MKELKKFTEELANASQIQSGDIPKIDLYIDQVIQLFESNFADAKRNDKEKILTKTMINNYAKGKLFYPVHNKKYSRNHIMLISLIYQMKSALSINDVKLVLDGLNERAEKQGLDLEEFYENYLSLQQKNLELFREGIDKQMRDVSEQAEMTGEEKEMQQVLLIASLVHTSNLYRRAAEKLVDEMSKGGEQNGENTD